MYCNDCGAKWFDFYSLDYKSHRLTVISDPFWILHHDVSV